MSAAEKVADNLYMVPGQGGNTAVWVMANGVLLVDTKLANNGQAILDEVKKVTDKPITYILNTHTHGDHTGSNQFFPASVQVVVHENTAANMAKMDVFKEAANKHGLADRTYKDKLTLFRGNEEVELYHFGAAHTNGDSFIVFKNARVMHSGDAFANKGQPFIDRGNGGSGVAYPATLKKAAREIKNVDRVIPGHAAVLPWQDFVDAGDFNQLMLDHARAALAAKQDARSRPSRSSRCPRVSRPRASRPRRPAAAVPAATSPCSSRNCKARSRPFGRGSPRRPGRTRPACKEGR